MNTNIRNRKHRLKRIEEAKIDLESALLNLREHLPKAGWVRGSFKSLYYLHSLARKAP